jgi:phosphoribosylformylglycinamidine (FGAM) synthase-like amidotransferase family enzyme
MMLLGLQALLGFQIVADFNQRFQELPTSTQAEHINTLAGCGGYSYGDDARRLASHRGTASGIDNNGIDCIDN